ncbi:MAG: hypothetical protein OXF88_21670, partial [Rhodobacteraceae bacterium]|nr:hypothetical protein [Paracoccaceae bacterium]
TASVASLDLLKAKCGRRVFVRGAMRNPSIAKILRVEDVGRVLNSIPFRLSIQVASCTVGPHTARESNMTAAAYGLERAETGKDRENGEARLKLPGYLTHRLETVLAECKTPTFAGVSPPEQVR